jgi:hypothetical protein
MSDKIILKRDDEILAHHTTESCLSSYGQIVWVIEDLHPDPGPVMWFQGDNIQHLEIVDLVGGWLVVRQDNKLLAGIIWSDGNYYADAIIDPDGNPCLSLSPGCRVAGTIRFDNADSQDLGSILSSFF